MPSRVCLRWLAIEFTKDIGDWYLQARQDIVAGQCFVFVQDFVVVHSCVVQIRILSETWQVGVSGFRPGRADTSNVGAVRPCHYPRFSCPQSARPTGANVLRLVARQRKRAPLPARPAGSEVSFTSIPAGQAGTGIACCTPFWLIEKRIHLRGKHAGVCKRG